MDNNSKPSFINERPVTAGRFLFRLICSLVEYHRSLNNFAFAYVLSHCCVVREKHTMIRTCISAFLILIAGYCYAQETKGRFLFNGGFACGRPQQHRTSDEIIIDISNRYYAGTFNLGYHITSEFAAGVMGFLISTKEQTKYDMPSVDPFYTISSRYQHIGIFTRYHHLFVENKFGFVTYLSGGYAQGQWRLEEAFGGPDDGPRKDAGTYRGKFIRLSPGFIYFIGNRFSLETSLGNIDYTKGISRSSSTQAKEKGWTSNLFPISFSFTCYTGRCKKKQ